MSDSYIDEEMRYAFIYLVILEWLLLKLQLNEYHWFQCILSFMRYIHRYIFNNVRFFCKFIV